jgi:PPOX class probable F420-dependent enzyme
MSPSMTKKEREEFLTDVHVGVLCVSEAAGRGPIAVPVWYIYRPGGTVDLTTGRQTRKAVAIAAVGRFSMCVQDENPPFKYVTVEGPAILVEADSAERREIARRYLGTEAGDAYVAQNPATDSVVIRMAPEHWSTADFGKAM